jgi:hypothetical protein
MSALSVDKTSKVYVYVYVVSRISSSEKMEMSTGKGCSKPRVERGLG